MHYNLGKTLQVAPCCSWQHHLAELTARPAAFGNHRLAVLTAWPAAVGNHRLAVLTAWPALGTMQALFPTVRWLPCAGR